MQAGHGAADARAEQMMEGSTRWAMWVGETGALGAPLVVCVVVDCVVDGDMAEAGREQAGVGGRMLRR